MTTTQGNAGAIDDQPRTKTDAAYQALRRAIVTGEIGPNEPLDENLLQQRYRLGRTPLREALKRLAREQFATWPVHSTPFVRGISADELSDLYQTRIILEEPASRIAAASITDAQLDRLDEISVQIEVLIAEGEIYKAVESDHALHLAIAQITGNRFLAEAVSNLNCGSLRLWYTAHERLHDQTRTPRHSHLIEALRSRDPERAAEETRKHILRSHQRQLALQAQNSISPVAATGTLAPTPAPRTPPAPTRPTPPTPPAPRKPR
jgi:GntR family transcriptional regulator, rspAB operon transcriptional repressor